MLEDVGKWMDINGEAVYGSKAWKTLGEGEIVNGKLKKLPGGKLGGGQARFKFDAQDIRFTEGKDGSLYVFTMEIPSTEQKVVVKSMAKDKGYLSSDIKDVSLLGYKGKVKWQYTNDGLEIIYPKDAQLNTSAVFKVKK